MNLSSILLALKIGSRCAFQVPTFKDGDLVVNESGATCMYLEERNSNDSNRLFPADPAARSAVYQKVFETANIQSNVMMPLVYYMMRTKKEDFDEKVFQEGMQKAKDELAFWNKVKYCLPFPPFLHFKLKYFMIVFMSFY